MHYLTSIPLSSVPFFSSLYPSCFAFICFIIHWLSLPCVPFLCVPLLWSRCHVSHGAHCAASLSTLELCYCSVFRNAQKLMEWLLYVNEVQKIHISYITPMSYSLYSWSQEYDTFSNYTGNEKRISSKLLKHKAVECTVASSSSVTR